jgi:hypothetical protein
MHRRETLSCLRDARNTELRKSHMKNDEVKKSPQNHQASVHASMISFSSDFPRRVRIR